MSSFSYFLATAVIGDRATKGDDIGKICLWFIPMILEALSYFYIIRKAEFVQCDSEGLRDRSRVLFTIILGEGNLSPHV
jgi:hypothetical protein